MMTIPLDFLPDDRIMEPVASVLPESTTKESHAIEIDSIIKSLNGERGKTVAARALCFDYKIDINATFHSLCNAYPYAFVFAFSTEATGTWIGASPELLLKIEDPCVSTMSLAGTRPSDQTGEWDEKNIDEQKMVTEFICKNLEKKCTDVTTENTYTRNAGAICHICTPISAKLSSGDECSIMDILTLLSPTPAVCGSDRDTSLKLIKEYEGFDRHLYGGFCGPNDINGVKSFYVILRTAKCNPAKTCVFAGGGITPLSDHEQEWNETESKLKTIIKHLKSKEK